MRALDENENENENEAARADVRAAAEHCPSWCVTSHGSYSGEENWVHVGAPLALTDDTAAQLCLSVDPETGCGDGPYVLIGATERTLQEADALGISLVGLARTGENATPPAGA